MHVPSRGNLFNMTDDLYYLTNPSGLVAVSHDRGETIIIPSGKVMHAIPPWEEVSEDLFSQLTDKQREVLAMFINHPEPTGMDKIIRDYQKRRDAYEQKHQIVHDAPRPLPMSDRVAVVKADKK